MADVSAVMRSSFSPQSWRRAIGWLCVSAAFALLSACTGEGELDAAFSRAGSAHPPIKAETFAELQANVLGRDADLQLFTARGPFSVSIQEDRELRLPSGERMQADVFLSSASQKAPLVIFLHGYESSKRAHGRQAAHVAAWGMHALSVQLSKKGPWETNGASLARLVTFIQRSPQAIDSRIDASRIILVGHSFGAYAVTVALAGTSPAAGAILLDPAAAGKDVAAVLRRVQKPVMIIGADDEVSPTRNRDAFYEYIRSGVGEVSIRDAAHEDAQYPSEAALHNGGVDPDTTEALQVTFVAALTAAAFSLAATGAFDHAWSAFRRPVQDGRFFDPKKK